MNYLLYVLLLAPPTDGGQGNSWVSLIPLLLIIAVFYLFLFRPQYKKQKEMRTFRSSLKKGDKVITVGGIYGRILELEENAVFLEIAPNVKIKVDKNGLVHDPSDITPAQK